MVFSYVAQNKNIASLNLPAMNISSLFRAGNGLFRLLTFTQPVKLFEAWLAARSMAA